MVDPCRHSDIPYSQKAWRVESLANMANHLQFAKLKPLKLVVSMNNLLVDLFIHRTFFCKHLKRVNLPNIFPPNFPAIQYIIHVPQNSLIEQSPHLFDIKDRFSYWRVCLGRLKYHSNNK